MSERVKELSHHEALAELCKRQLAEAEKRHNEACAEARILRQELATYSSDTEHALSKLDTMRAYVNRMEAHMGAAVKAIKQTLEVSSSSDMEYVQIYGVAVAGGTQK